MTKKIISLFLLSAMLILTACSGSAKTPEDEALENTFPAKEVVSDEKESEGTSNDATLTNEKVAELKMQYEQTLLNNTIREVSVSVNQPILIEVEGTLTLENVQASNPKSIKIIAVHLFNENGTAKSLIEVQPMNKGEHFITLESGDTSVVFQIFALDHSNTEGNIVELVGNVSAIHDDNVELIMNDKTYSIYTASSNKLSEFKVGDSVIIGARLGEASYQLAFITQNEDKTNDSDLPVIQHVVKIESIQDEIVEVLWNDALLMIYHNDLLTTHDEGAYVYVEYAVDKASEANELLKVEKIQ